MASTVQAATSVFYSFQKHYFINHSTLQCFLSNGAKWTVRKIKVICSKESEVIRRVMMGHSITLQLAVYLQNKCFQNRCKTAWPLLTTTVWCVRMFNCQENWLL
jgi:hypothetical protein